MALKLTVSASRGSPPSSTWPARNCASNSRAVFHSATSAQLQVVAGTTQRKTEGDVNRCGYSSPNTYIQGSSVFNVSSKIPTSSVKPVLQTGLHQLFQVAAPSTKAPGRNGQTSHNKWTSIAEHDSRFDRDIECARIWMLPLRRILRLHILQHLKRCPPFSRDSAPEKEEE